MAYSLKNHEDRIKILEQSAGSLSVIAWSKSENGYIQFSNGLIINWGTTKSFNKAFPNAPLGIALAPLQKGYNSYVEHISVTSLTKTGYSTQNTSFPTRFIAIGYLITNRLLNYIYAKLNSFKNLKGVAHEQNSDMSCCNVVDIHAIAKRSSRLFNHIMIDREVA